MQDEFNDHDAETVNEAIRTIRSNTGIDLFPARSPNAELHSFLMRSFCAKLAAKLEAEANARLGANHVAK